MEKSLRIENQKRKKVTGKKRKKEEKKKNRPKEERKSTILSRKEKTFFVKAIGTGGAPRCPDFEQEIAANQNLPHIMFKTRFPFLYASTSLDTKTLTIASNRNFESCMSIRCLAHQPGSRFFPFLPWFSFAFGNFAHYCVVLLNAL